MEFEELVGPKLADEIIGDSILANQLHRQPGFSFYSQKIRPWQILLGVIGFIFSVILINFAIWAIFLER